MKIKYCIGLLLISAIVFFIIGLRMGIKQGTLDTIPIMLDKQRFYIAARVASLINDLYLIKENPKNDINCQLKKIIEKRVSDWQSCKENQYCTKEVSVGFFVHTDTKIADFMALSCGE
jgi:hypothetical protein